MLITSDDNGTPRVGELFYNEYRSEDGQFLNSSLNFIDTEPQEGEQWMYTEIASMENFGEGMQVYNYFEAGGMPPGNITRIAKDEDIKRFIDLMKSGNITEDSSGLKEWIDSIESDQILLDREKERIKLLAS